jgi:hypothetical protein
MNKPLARRMFKMSDEIKFVIKAYFEDKDGEVLAESVNSKMVPSPEDVIKEGLTASFDELQRIVIDEINESVAEVMSQLVISEVKKNR